ncbi:MAG: hypothetical protein E6H84_12905 [Chloroflexi bacterium]|nr:MAG: hypothetical protein E6H84_12905 [Chloroflexota bacterium]
MVSNDVNALAIGESCDALLLTAKARVIAPLRVLRRGRGWRRWTTSERSRCASVASSRSTTSLRLAIRRSSCRSISVRTARASLPPPCDAGMTGPTCSGGSWSA